MVKDFAKKLYDHITTFIWFSFNLTKTSPTGQIDDIYDLAFHSSGGLTTIGISHLAAFINLNGNESLLLIISLIMLINQRNHQTFKHMDQLNHKPKWSNKDC